MKAEIQISIRALAEFLRRSGSIDSRFSGLNRGVEGSRAHRMLQKQGGKHYKAEVPLEITMEHNGLTYQLAGRADGIIEKDGNTTVDEIKTTTQLLDTLEENSNPAHWAQGCLYAYIVCQNKNLAQISVQLTYFNVDDGAKRRFTRQYTSPELEAFVQELLADYHPWALLSLNWKQERDISLRQLVFPFAGYRSGQRTMAIGAYNAFKEGTRLFCCAPTGIGKTISTLFPAVKALGEGYGERIFYLTAKTITRTAAEDALSLLQGQADPLRLKSITITAKDKMCFLEERSCLPEICPYANGYYDRINTAMYQLLQEQQTFTRQTIEDAARLHRLCPYELTLDLSLWCDVVVCDYNYLFDPVVRLQRFFEGSEGDNLFLVDEAHNLPDRSREMYSARLSREPFFTFKKALPKQYAQLHKALAAVNTGFVALRHRCEDEDTAILNFAGLPAELQKPLEHFTTAAEEFLEQNRGNEQENDLLALYFEVLFYSKIADGYNDTYTTLVYRHHNNITVKLFCMNPAPFLNESLQKGRAAVFFSATLLPLPYYKEVLGSSNGKLLNLPSPFPQNNLGLFVADTISTRYNSRQQSSAAVVTLLHQMVNAKKGNYIAYFPSYSYMRQIAELFKQEHPQVQLLIQQTGMDEQEREDFLQQFTEETEEGLLGFCVLGGIFSEGVDLAGNRLIGTAIVGVGLPQIGPELDALRAYYDTAGQDGFAFAYQFPGMNKVLQAAGRVIRAEDDRGVVLLVDERFTTSRYQALFPAHWGHWQGATPATLPGLLQQFWQQQEKE